jgi:hypothetical protein
MYGLPITREFEMNDRHDVFNVVRNFNECPLPKRYILATNIKKAFNEFDIRQPVAVEESNSILNFLNSDFVVVTESVKIVEHKINEMDVNEFKFEVMNRINELIDKTIPNEMVTESFEDKLLCDEKINKYFAENDLNNLSSRLNHLKNYGLVNDLDEIDIITAIRAISKNDQVHYPKVECELGNLICVNDNMYLLCKQKDITNEFLLLPAETLDLKSSKRVVIENSKTVNTDIKSLIKKIKKMS